MISHEIMKKFEYTSESIKLMMKRVEMIEKNVRSLHETQKTLIRLTKDISTILETNLGDNS